MNHERLEWFIFLHDIGQFLGEQLLNVSQDTKLNLTNFTDVSLVANWLSNVDKFGKNFNETTIAINIINKFNSVITK